MKEVFYSIRRKDNFIYHTGNEIFQFSFMERSDDSKRYLERLIKEDPIKFADCKIVANSVSTYAEAHEVLKEYTEVLKHTLDVDHVCFSDVRALYGFLDSNGIDYGNNMDTFTKRVNGKQVWSFQNGLKVCLISFKELEDCDSRFKSMQGVNNGRFTIEEINEENRTVYSEDGKVLVYHRDEKFEDYKEQYEDKVKFKSQWKEFEAIKPHLTVNGKFIDCGYLVADFFLNSLPPVDMTSGCFIAGEAWEHDEDDRAVYIFFRIDYQKETASVSFTNRYTVAEALQAQADPTFYKPTGKRREQIIETIKGHLSVFDDKSQNEFTRQEAAKTANHLRRKYSIKHEELN